MYSDNLAGGKFPEENQPSLSGNQNPLLQNARKGKKKHSSKNPQAFGELCRYTRLPDRKRRRGTKRCT